MRTPHAVEIDPSPQPGLRVAGGPRLPAGASRGARRQGAGTRMSPWACTRIGGALFLAAALMMLSACDGILNSEGGGPPPEITELPRALTDAEVRTIGASNAFGFELLREVLADDPESSVFLSPFSASTALGMTLNGAHGETFEAMRSTLQFGDLTETEINASYRGMLDLLTALDPGVELTIANAVWVRQGSALRESFRSRVAASFDARAEELDFGHPGAADVINGWVREATRNRIDEMVEPPISPRIVAYLMNAVYFNAGWTRTFDPEDTRTGDFHRLDGSTAPVEFMTREDTAAVHFGQGWSAVDLPYAGQAWAMTVVVPWTDRSIHEVLATFSMEDWEALTAGLRSTRAQITLPRFELEWEAVLNEPLKRMGMEVAFDGRADFTRMFENASPWISEVKQKSFVRVDEEGTEAAAVTSVSMEESAPGEVRADRPFLFVIRERLSGTILFMGVIVEPPTM